MHVKAPAFALATVLAASVSAEIGRSLTSWDCCKPACAWSNILSRAGASGSVKVCGKDDRALSSSQGAREQSSCGDTSSTRGNAYLCSDYSPKPVSDELSLGFAITKDSANCCKCFEVRWVDGPAKGKRMQVQVINSGGSVDDGLRDFIILVPGGGVGPNTAGCSSQFGNEWGRRYGGVTQMQDCETLPSNLQGGCYWRWNWAKGDINDWPIEWSSITCPDYLTGVSGCKPGK